MWRAERKRLNLERNAVTLIGSELNRLILSVKGKRERHCKIQTAQNGMAIFGWMFARALDSQLVVKKHFDIVQQSDSEEKLML